MAVQRMHEGLGDRDERHSALPLPEVVSSGDVQGEGLCWIVQKFRDLAGRVYMHPEGLDLTRSWAPSPDGVDQWGDTRFASKQEINRANIAIASEALASIIDDPDLSFDHFFDVYYRLMFAFGEENLRERLPSEEQNQFVFGIFAHFGQKTFWEDLYAFMEMHEFTPEQIEMVETLTEAALGQNFEVSKVSVRTRRGVLFAKRGLPSVPDLHLKNQGRNYTRRGLISYCGDNATCFQVVEDLQHRLVGWTREDNRYSEIKGKKKGERYLPVRVYNRLFSVPEGIDFED